MTKFVNWCSSHKLANILLILVYYILVVAPHKLFGTFLLVTVLPGMADSITARNEYNLIIIIIAVLVLLSYCLIFAYYVNKSSEKKKLWGYMIVNIALASIVINILFVINTEVIHFPQYALFAILLFPLVGNYTATLVWATLGGMLDEAYQYFYLAPLDTSFYDLNDVVTNIIGAVF